MKPITVNIAGEKWTIDLWGLSCGNFLQKQVYKLSTEMDQHVQNLQWKGLFYFLSRGNEHEDSLTRKEECYFFLKIFKARFIWILTGKNVFHTNGTRPHLKNPISESENSTTSKIWLVCEQAQKRSDPTGRSLVTRLRRKRARAPGQSRCSQANIWPRLTSNGFCFRKTF